MKKITQIITLITLIGTTLWAYNNNWVLDKNTLDNNETSYTLNYAQNRGKPLFFCLAQVDKAFSIRVMLPFENNQIQEELREYYETKLPKELNKALKSSGNLHNPTLKALIKHFPSAFRSTTFYKKLEESLKDKGYGIDKEITFEKFTIEKHKKPYLFFADIWLETTPFVKLMQSVKKTFPNYSEEKLNIMFQDSLWNYKKSAVVIYPSNKIYLFIKNESDKFIGVDISRVERINLGTIGSNRKFKKVETKAVKWMEHEKYYQVHIETKAWSKGQRYRASERLLIDKNGRVLWR